MGEPTFDALREAFADRSMPLSEEDMEALGITRDGKPTGLGHILSDQCDLSLKVAAFGDDPRFDVMERAEFGGCVIRQISCALSFMDRYNRLSSRIEGFRRVDRRAYPEASLKEAVATAVAVRSYVVDDPILISIFPTKMTVTAPKMPDGDCTPEKLLCSAPSICNEELMEIMRRLGIIDAAGTDISGMIEPYEGASKIPNVSIGRSTFTISLPATDAEDDPCQSFLDGRVEFRRADLEAEMGISRSKAVEMVRTMLEKGLIVRIGGGRSTRYRPTGRSRPWTRP